MEQANRHSTVIRKTTATFGNHHYFGCTTRPVQCMFQRRRVSKMINDKYRIRQILISWIRILVIFIPKSSTWISSITLKGNTKPLEGLLIFYRMQLLMMALNRKERVRLLKSAATKFKSCIRSQPESFQTLYQWGRALFYQAVHLLETQKVGENAK